MSEKVTLAEVASEIPNAGKEESLIMKLRRWVGNENIDMETYFLPFIQSLLQSISNQTIVLVIDGSTIGKGFGQFHCTDP